MVLLGTGPSADGHSGSPHCLLLLLDGVCPTSPSTVGTASFWPLFFLHV